MIGDRPYMRSSGSRLNLSVTMIILAINALVFVIENAGGYGIKRDFTEYGALSLDGLRHWRLWQFFTFQFLHGGIGHLFINGFVLYSFGRALEAELGKSSFLKLYFLSGFAGGVLQVLVALIWKRFDGPMVGASAGICGLIAAYSLMSPNSMIYLFLVLPLRARYFLPLMIALPIVSMVIEARGQGTQIAHAAHLGGTLFGVVYLRWLRGWEHLVDFWQRFLPRRRSRPIVKVRFPKANSAWEPDPAPPRRTDEGDFISKEVDPILDKIREHGIQSLTPREREILEKARERMERR